MTGKRNQREIHSTLSEIRISLDLMRLFFWREIFLLEVERNPLDLE